MTDKDTSENNLPRRVKEMYTRRGWPTTWPHRGVYLHLEASELIEAIRGKHGDPTEEAADVLICLMAITETEGIAWNDVIQAVSDKVTKLMTAPRYQGEHYE